MRIYTIEIYNPPYPNMSDHYRVHVGSFEDNRDNLSPTMIATQEVQASNVKCARVRAREFYSKFRRTP